MIFFQENTDIVGPIPRRNCGSFFLLVIPATFIKLVQGIFCNIMRDNSISKDFIDGWVPAYGESPHISSESEAEFYW